MSDLATPAPWGAADDAPRSAELVFHGRRAPFFGLIVGGLLAMVPTLGLYRFWLVTRKRQVYWEQTELDGDALEYTGTPVQLLVGFLLAVLIFLPIYISLFYITIRAPDFSALAYLVLVPGFYFLMGYAAYRSRRFRLSRTLWRGIRFQQSGNAWAYAWRRFWWTLVTILTLGLSYPFMARSLWRYRIENTLFGDRRFCFEGRVRTIALPFYLAWVVVVALAVLVSFLTVGAFSGAGSGPDMAALIAVVYGFALAGVGYLAWLYVSTRIDTRFWSSVRLGEARLSLRIRARDIALQHLVYALALSLLAGVFGFAGTSLLAGMTAGIDIAGGAPTQQDIARLMQTGSAAFVVLIAVYLAFVGLWSALAETIMGFGYWKIVVRRARVDNIESLNSARAAGTESPLAGEGLADALNVGVY
ncbi:MAG: DUF898 domain-containing protein [Alphaproteobacteria bacterium]|nr:DUF898 domain-containing protein [Alphaproteobacteria bacterium]